MIWKNAGDNGWEHVLRSEIFENRHELMSISGNALRAELREQENLDPTEAVVLRELEDKIPGKLGTFIGIFIEPTSKHDEAGFVGAKIGKSSPISLSARGPVKKQPPYTGSGTDLTQFSNL